MSALLTVEGVRKDFGGLRALQGCELEIADGEVAGLIGPNGSGKTTLFNVITGFETVRTGTVRFNGRTITNTSPDRIFQLGIGRTFQTTRIFARLTVMENMLVGYQRRGGMFRNLLRTAGTSTERTEARRLLEFVGIARLAGEPAGTLSYGQRKLLELAYVLVADPAVILLDEPAGGVNPTLITHIGERIRELNHDGRTFLIVEHNMEFVMGLCDRVTVLHQGAAIATGPAAAIRTDPRVLDAYLGGPEGDADAY